MDILHVVGNFLREHPVVWIVPLIAIVIPVVASMAVAVPTVQAGIVALDLSGAPTHTVDYTTPLDDGTTYHFVATGEEDPWAVHVTFKGGPDGVTDPQVGDLRLTAQLQAGEESAAMPYDGLVRGDNALKVRVTNGTVLIRFTYEEGRAPQVRNVHIQSDGVHADAVDPNADSGDQVTSYWFVIRNNQQQPVLSVNTSDSVLRQLPTSPGDYSVTVTVTDLRGATSAGLARDFTILGTLSGASTGVGGPVSEGDATLAAPAHDQDGHLILSQVDTSAGPSHFPKRVIWGYIVLAGCIPSGKVPGLAPCIDPIDDTWISIFPAKWRASWLGWFA